MSNRRLELIKKIEQMRSSKILAYATGDRPPFTTQIAGDAMRIVQKHLDSIGMQETIGLFLYSAGGDMITPLRLVRLIREYCKYFQVLVPYRAHSAATLICLGADKLVMGKLAELSPVDPTTAHPFNPVDPTDPQKNKKVPISVEDVTSYFLFAKERACIRDEQMVNIFNELTNKIHPLALGNIYRGHRMIRMLAKRLLLLHLNEDKDRHRIEETIKKLTEELCIHGYLISREEAQKELGLDIEKPDNQLESLMWNLYKEYETDMELTVPFDPIGLLSGQPAKTLSYHGAYIESVYGTDRFVFNVEIKLMVGPSGRPEPMINVTSPPRWEEVNKQEKGV